MSIRLFFNGETGTCERDDGLRALVSTAAAYHEFRKNVQEVFSESAKSVNLPIFKHEGVPFSLQTCMHLLITKERHLVQILLQSLSKGTVLDNLSLSECEGWIVKEIGAHSPFMEFAARHEGMLLTVATTEDWKCDFFTFFESSTELPNLWGQTDSSYLTNWVAQQHRRQGDYLNILEKIFGCHICHNAIKNSDLIASEWNIVIDLFKRANDLEYRPSASKYPIKDITAHKTKHGGLLELRNVGKGIRIFLVSTIHGPVVGGFYKKGMGINQSDAVSRACTRINSYNIC